MQNSSFCTKFEKSYLTSFQRTSKSKYTRANNLIISFDKKNKCVVKSPKQKKNEMIDWCSNKERKHNRDDEREEANNTNDTHEVYRLCNMR